MSKKYIKQNIIDSLNNIICLQFIKFGKYTYYI